jgi:hypothetical protein
MKTVFECAFGVEAHLVSNLLRDAGIANQVLGEFLQGAAGELPVGRLVRVVVPDEQADAARVVIAEWEDAAPPVFSDPDEVRAVAASSGKWLNRLFAALMMVMVLGYVASRL